MPMHPLARPLIATGLLLGLLTPGLRAVVAAEGDVFASSLTAQPGRTWNAWGENGRTATVRVEEDAALGRILVMTQTDADGAGGVAIRADGAVTGGGAYRFTLQVRGEGDLAVHLVERAADKRVVKRSMDAFTPGLITLGATWREWSRLVALQADTASVELVLLFHRSVGTAAIGGLGAAPASPLVMQADGTWLALDGASIATAPGSILDLGAAIPRSPVDAGRIVATADGHYAEAASGRRLRFFGTNLNYKANYLPHAAADRLADDLVRCGYNAVRIHHHDGLLLPAGAAALDAERLDRLDYLVAACATRGLRLVTDFYCNRDFAPGEVEGLAEGAKGSDVKVLAAFEPGALAAWRRFPALLLAHRNPYTGRTWAEEPALVSAAPINENVLIAYAGRPNLKAYLESRFAAALAEQGLALAAGGERDARFIRWLGEVQERHNRELTRILRDELGFQGLITGLSHRSLPPHALTRRHFDLVEMHGYWDHPQFLGRDWSLPYLFTQDSAVTARDGQVLPVFWGPSRLYGKPYQYTEFNAVAPNRHRAEGGVLMGAYAALQDWDGLYRFGHLSLDTWEETADPLAMRPFVAFRTAYDPMSRLSDRLIALLFARGDVAPARTRSAYAVSGADYPARRQEWTFGGFPAGFIARGFRQQVGSVAAEAPPADLARFELVAGRTPLVDGTRPVDPAALPVETPDPLVSDTGEIALDRAAGTLRVVTARSEAFVLRGAARALAGGFARVADAVDAVVAVSAHDGRPLAESRRLLVLHLTDARNTGMRFDDAGATVLQAWGGLPVLVRRGTASLHLAIRPAEWRCWAVDWAGNRRDEVALAAADGGALLALDTRRPGGPALAYDLERR